MSLISKDLLLPLMSFYVKKVKFNPKVDSISMKSLNTLRGLKWSKEKIVAFNQYQIEFKNWNTPLESDLDDNFEDMWRIEHHISLLMSISRVMTMKRGKSNQELKYLVERSSPKRKLEKLL